MQFWRLEVHSQGVVKTEGSRGESVSCLSCDVASNTWHPLAYFLNCHNCQFIEEFVVIKVNSTDLINFHDVK